MTQEEKVNLCLKCRFKKFDLQKGLLCNRTGQVADFDEECAGFWNENQYSKTQPDNLLINTARFQTIIVFSCLIVLESLLVLMQLLSKSHYDLLIPSLVIILINLVLFIAIYFGKKWFKNILTTLYLILALGGLIFLLLSNRIFFINVSPELMLKVIIAVLLLSITVCYINLSKTFIRFFNFQNKNKHHSL